jgi:hypothetical protein
VDALSLLFLFVAGIVSGFLAGFFGVGGGIVLVPVLLIFFDGAGVSSLVATHLTFGTSLFVVVFASLTSAYQYSRNGHVVWRAVLFMGLASVVGTIIGTNAAGMLHAKTLQRFFAAVVVVAALRLLRGPEKQKEAAKPKLSPAGLGSTGLVVGLVSSLAGVGGGVFSIPMMHHLLDFPLKKALGTSSATIVITAASAAVGYVVAGWGNTLLPDYAFGYVDCLHSLPVIAGTLPFATIGASAAHKTKETVLRKAFAIFLLVIAVKMFFF